MIFTSFSIGGIRIKNRFIKSALVDFPGELNGYCSESYIRYLEKLARGEVGLICTAPASIQSDFRANHYQLSISSQKAADSYKDLIEKVHYYNAKIFLYPEYSNEVLIKFLISIIEPSHHARAFENMRTWVTSSLKRDEIMEIIDLYKKAAIRAKQAGFDGILLNATFGTFLHTMSSSALNNRSDEWGGDLTGRMRIFKEIIYNCKTLDFPVMVRWNVKDYNPGGRDIKESIKACQLLQSYGADALELSAFSSVESTIALNKDIEQRKFLPFIEGNDLVDYYRIMHPFIQNSFFVDRKDEIKLPMEYAWGHAYYNVWPIKKSLDIPVSLLGGVRTLESAKKIVTSGTSDFVSLMQTLVYDPQQCRKFKEDISCYSGCISCNCCMNQMFLSLKDPSRPYLHHCLIKG
ncbi:hypothetical protein J7J45_02325 [Candidatus Aerophobetes bacterium]|nr:hypothetical protein [Candidatus Aerophobetes bacterium]